MKKLLIFLMSLVLAIITNGQSNEERLHQIDQEIKAAVETEDYSKAEKLKKEKDIRLQIKDAIAKGDFAKAGELKSSLGGASKIKKQETKTKKKDTKSSWAEFNFETIKNESLKPEFPAMRICDDKRYVNPIGVINGIEIGYYMDVDSDIDFDGYSDTYYDITLVFRNLTGKKLVFNSPMDLVGQVKFTGEEVEIYLENYVEERLGGKCPFYAEFLDHENGKYVMHPNEDYYGDYSINQESEGWLELIWLRRLKPLWFESYIPSKQYASSYKTDVRFFPGSDLEKSSNENIGGFVKRKIKLPNKRIECTFAERGLSLKEPLKQEGSHKVLFENDRLKVTYFIDKSKGSFKKDGGYMKYPINIKIYNKSSQAFDPYKELGASSIIGYYEFNNSYRLPLRSAYKQQGSWYRKVIPANGMIEYDDKLLVTLYSGELFVGSSITKRKLEEDRDIVPVKLFMHKRAILSSSELGHKSADGKTRIVMFIKRAENSDIIQKSEYGDAGYIRMFNENQYFQYIGMDDSKYHTSRINNVTEFELSNAGDFQIFIARDKPTTLKKMQKSVDGKIAIGVQSGQASVKEGWTTYVIYRYQHGIKAITKEEYDAFVEKSNPNISKVVLN